MAKEKPLTLSELIKYNQEVVFPFMQENFAGKKDFEEFKNDMTEFKNDMLGFEDKALEDLEVLKQEKTMRDAQDKRKTKVLEIHNNALKSNKILSSKQSAEIDGLRAF